MAVKRGRGRKSAGRRRTRKSASSRVWAVVIIIVAGAAAAVLWNVMYKRGLFRPAPAVVSMAAPAAVESAANPASAPAAPAPKAVKPAAPAPAPAAAPAPAPVAAPAPAPAAPVVAAPSEPASASGCAAVELDQAVSYFNQGSAIFVDARSAQSYGLGHIPNAVNLPSADLEAGFAKVQGSLPLEARVIVYCQSESCEQAVKVCDFLAGKGYKNLSHFKKGWLTWEYSGLPKQP